MPNVLLHPCQRANIETKTEYTQVGTLKLSKKGSNISVPLFNEAIGSPLKIRHTGSTRCLRLEATTDTNPSGLRIRHKTTTKSVTSNNLI